MPEFGLPSSLHVLCASSLVSRFVLGVARLRKSTPVAADSTMKTKELNDGLKTKLCLGKRARVRADTLGFQDALRISFVDFSGA